MKRKCWVRGVALCRGRGDPLFSLHKPFWWQLTFSSREQKNYTLGSKKNERSSETAGVWLSDDFSKSQEQQDYKDQFCFLYQAGIENPIRESESRDRNLNRGKEVIKHGIESFGILSFGLQFASALMS